jgi:hypothetical protein
MPNSSAMVQPNAPLGSLPLVYYGHSFNKTVPALAHFEVAFGLQRLHNI